MPRSVKTSRIIAEATLTTGDLPASAGDAVCFSVTVPTRGFIHRVSMPLIYTSAVSGDPDAGAMYLHTAGPGTSGTTPLSTAQAATIFAQATVNPEHSDTTGADLAIAGSRYVWCPVLDFSQGMSTAITTGGGHTGLMYDLSGTTLGPVSGTSTLYGVWIGDGNVNFTTNITSAKVRFEIEPLS
jgi:hypothetical protein|tara:strand:- start:667 stop:1218 length:552 start_codon:yes stop_codon:yes gene_type:complete